MRSFFSLPFVSLFKTILNGKHSLLFFTAAIASFAFSISVILCTIGLMDGFEYTLKQGLLKSSGDLKVFSREGFFHYDNKLRNTLDHPAILHTTTLLQSEGFFMIEGLAKGVMIKGIDPKTFNEVTGLNIQVKANEMVIGTQLAKEFGLKADDDGVIALGKGNKGFSSLPSVKRLKISQVVTHGIYEKDLRYVYINKTDLIKFLDTQDKINLVLIKLKPEEQPFIDDVVFEIDERLESPYVVRPFWSEFSSLIEAVKVEKFSISLILQLIVLIAIFNIAAFVIFISEKKAQDFFLFQAFGMNKRTLFLFWLIVLILMWAMACLIAYPLTHLFNSYFLQLPFLRVPGEIYVLGELSLLLDTQAYVMVFGLSFLWIIGVALIGLMRINKRTILYGLRQEFA
ncbi:MAG: ABC transporter permease [Bacteriovoracaceae bacterium]|nr:ABC transporter permease [Bacteriovoracaceae bacterium]